MYILKRKIGEEVCLEIGKFAILWNCFESEHCNYSANTDAIKRACGKITIDLSKLTQFAETLKDRINFLGETIDAYVEEGLHPPLSRASTTADKNLMKSFLNQEGAFLNEGCLLIIYRIRNNLMHGLKCIEDLEYQLELFRKANSILESIC